jgi:3-phytase
MPALVSSPGDRLDAQGVPPAARTTVSRLSHGATAGPAGEYAVRLGRTSPSSDRRTHFAASLGSCTLYRQTLGRLPIAVATLLTAMVTLAGPVAAVPILPGSGPVPAKDETQAFSSGSGDIADDPAIWVDAADPSRSVVIGSKKAPSGGGLGVYDLAGDQIQFLDAGEPNNVEIRSNVFGGKVFLTVTGRTNNSLLFFFLDPATRTLTPAGATPVGFEPYGGCLYVSPTDGQVYFFVTNRNSPYDFDQYRLIASGATVSGVKVRDMGTSTLSEGCVADDPVGTSVFLSEEDKGVYLYSAEPTGGTSRSTVATVGTNGLTADAEGLAIARDRTSNAAYLIVSSQGSSNYQVYDAAPPFTFRKSCNVTASGSVDAVTGTDGLDVTRANLGALYPNGLLVVHDTSNSGGSTSNFKYVDAGLVLGNY